MKDVILQGDCIKMLANVPEKSVQTCVTSPPYFGLRDYGVEGQIGLEETPEAYVQRLVEVFRSVKRVLRDDGTIWLNLGDSYSAQRWSSGGGQPMNKNRDTHRSGNHAKNSGLPDKNLLGIPWRVAFALQADGWYLRQDIIWHKPNPMPESVTDRCTKAHEYIFLLSKSPTYYYDNDAIREPYVNVEKEATSRKITGFRDDFLGGHSSKGKGRESFYKNGGRNRRSVWTVTTKPYKGAHFATFPPDLITPCILAGSAVGDLVLDPFMGSGTTAAVAKKNGRHYLGTELNPEYIRLANKRLEETLPAQNTLLSGV